MIFARFRSRALLLKRCVAPMLCKNSPARNFRRTPLKEQGSNRRARMQLTCHDFCSFLLPRLALETLRGAYALQEFPRKTFSKNAFKRTKSNRRARMQLTCHDFCLFLLPRLALETLRGAYALQEFPRKKFSKNAFKRTRFQQKSANAVNLP